MKLKELFELPFVTDKTTFIISKPIIGNLCDIKKGNRYQDEILDLLDFKIINFSMDMDLNILSIALFKEEK